MAEERIGQVRGATHAVDASVGLVNYLGQGRARGIGRLHALEAGPQAFDRVESRRLLAPPCTVSRLVHQAPSPGGAAWRGTSPSGCEDLDGRYDPCKGQGRNVLGATAEGPGPLRGAAPSRISSAAPSTFLTNPDPVDPNSGAEPVQRRHRRNA